MRKQKSVRFNFIMNFILTASSVAFSLVTYPYISRMIQPAGIGQVSFATSIVSYLIMLSTLGIPTYGVRACAQVRDDRELLSKTVQELLIINLAMSAVCYGILAAAIYLVDEFRAVEQLLWISGAGIVLNALGANWFYSAIEEYGYITARSLVFKLLSVAFMFLFIRSPEDGAMYAVMMLIAAYGSGPLNFCRLKKYISFQRFENYSFGPHIRTALVFFAMSVATTVYTNLDVVMLGFMSGDAEVGYYSTSVRVKQIVVTLVTSLGAVLLPRLSYYIRSGNQSDFSRMVEKAIRFVLLCAVPLTVFFAICAEETILIISGDMYLDAVLSMQIIMPTVLLIGLTNVLGMQIMIPKGREKDVTLSVVAGGVVDVIINAMLIPAMGAAGAALGTLAAELVVLVVQAVMLRGELRQLTRISAGKPMAAAAAAGIAVLVVREYLYAGNLILLFFAEAIVFGAVYLLCLLVLKEQFLQEELIRRIRQFRMR